MKRVFRIVGIVLLLAIASLGTFLIILFFGGFGKIPSTTDLQNLKNNNTSIVTDKKGEVIGKYFTENRIDVEYADFPPFLVDALVATEDARFFQHKGVDSRALIRVLLKTIVLGDRGSGGGSTLSQQLAKNVYGRKDYGKFSILVNKLKEIILANRLENIYTKEQIITLYLNTVPFGENIYGIEVAAQRFFSVSVADLKVEEAAVLIGILKANTTYNPRLNPEKSTERRNVVLLQMNHYNYITDNGLDSLQKLELNLNYNNISTSTNTAYFLPLVEKELKTILQNIKNSDGTEYDYLNDGLTIKTTLNLQLQLTGIKAMNQHLSKMQVLLNQLYKNGTAKNDLNKLVNKIIEAEKLTFNSKKKARSVFYYDNQKTYFELTLLDSLKHTLKQLHAGLIAIQPKSGAINTWIGGIDYNHYPFDQILAKRQLASTFKPFLYALAIENGRSACDYLSNKPIVLNDYNNWSPQNYDGESGGQYSMAAALANSKNIPAVHLFFETDFKKLEEFWTRLGFESQLNEGPSVILGTNSVSMLELAKAYSVFANGGYKIDPYTIETIFDNEGNKIYNHKAQKRQQIIPSEVAEQTNEILVKAINEGTGKAIRSTYKLKIPLAGKTGTSQNFADAWFVGYNSDLLMVSRVGASYPSIHFNNGGNGSGGRLALPLVGLTLQEAIKSKDFSKFYRNSTLVASNTIDCEDYKEEDFIDNLFDLFKKKESNLENEKKRATKKRKVKGFFKGLFGKN